MTVTRAPRPLTFALLVLGFVLSVGTTVAADSDTGDWPRVTFVGAAASDVLQVVVRTGEAIHPRQGLYEAEPGDEVIEGHGSVLVRRGGEDYGALAWNDRSLFTPFERVIQAPFTPERWRQVTIMTIRSDGDPAYTGGRRPDRVELKTRPYEVSRVGGWQFEAPLAHHLFVFLPSPLVDGATYTLAVKGDGPEVPPYTHVPRTARSESVHVSQVGFRPDDPAKIAFLSTWTGTGGGLSYPDGPASRWWRRGPAKRSSRGRSPSAAARRTRTTAPTTATSRPTSSKRTFPPSTGPACIGSR